ncbi:peroxiredoxin [Boudabousia tangfeifanii]|uniref:thioredoxin-dependent peroxiredoxin n=1 Tax=Boudabousia tangfeifanii TaxID=1912795 RepID=A0A1D9MJP9_9ACTO|nr:peroxiredoxin [Boudabousia tangfeifanii]AOZ72524.1 peroxiredoxin [Boudabousia tangfeifanii]
MGMLMLDDVAPDFTLPTADGQVSLAELREKAEKGVVIYFYPKAETPGCTTEACDFRDNLGRLRQAGYEVVGISPDKPEALEKFAKNHELPFVLASDTAHVVMESYGAWGPKNNYGKTVIGTIRSTVVVLPDGRVKLALYNVKAKGHVDRLLRELEVGV